MFERKHVPLAPRPVFVRRVVRNFLIAQSMASRWPGTIFVSLRPETSEVYAIQRPLGEKRACENVDVLITATASTAPLVRDEWMAPGLHITSIGTDAPGAVELSAGCVRRADRVVVDSIALDHPKPPPAMFTGAMPQQSQIDGVIHDTHDPQRDKSWSFEPDVNETFMTKFIYEMEDEKMASALILFSRSWGAAAVASGAPIKKCLICSRR